MEYLVLGIRGRVVVNEVKARELLEKVRWPDERICPHCVVVGGHYRVMPRKGSKSPVRDGVWKCRDCRKQFTVTVGTVFQGSKIPLSKWLTAIYLLGDSAKGVNAHQLHRRLGLTYKSARFMTGRIAQSSRPGALARKLNSLLEAEGARIVRKRAERGASGSKGKAEGARKTVPGKGGAPLRSSRPNRGKGIKADKTGKKAGVKTIAGKSGASAGGGKSREVGSRRAPTKRAPKRKR